MIPIPRSAATKRERLRQLLSDGKWHSHREMTRAGGARFGARILEIRCGEDGSEPLNVEKRQLSDNVWQYRANLKTPAPVRVTSRSTLAGLRVENALLRARLAELEARHG